MTFHVYVDKEKFYGVSCFAINAEYYDTSDGVVSFGNKDDKAVASFASDYVSGIVMIEDGNER